MQYINVRRAAGSDCKPSVLSVGAVALSSGVYTCGRREQSGSFGNHVLAIHSETG